MLQNHYRTVIGLERHYRVGDDALLVMRISHLLKAGASRYHFFIQILIVLLPIETIQ